MPDKKPSGPMPKQTGTMQKGPARPGGTEAKPVSVKGAQTKKK